MKNNSLSDKGLSLSQAQSISNLCHQMARDIETELSSVNNSQKELKIGDELYVETVGNPIPTNVVDILTKKAKFHACQAFLMVNIKAKETLLNQVKHENFVHDLTEPEYPVLEHYEPIKLVDEEWGWSQLSVSEYNEFLESEAFASHIGQFIHKDGKLDVLRKELSKIKTLEWITIKDGEKTPLKVTVHHTQKELMDIHENLSAIHRVHEQRVNYYKSKIKNLVSEENARISKENSVKLAEINTKNNNLLLKYENDIKSFNGEVLKLKSDFEVKRQEKIKNISSLRILVDSRFQNTIDYFLKKIEVTND